MIQLLPISALEAAALGSAQEDPSRHTARSFSHSSHGNRPRKFLGCSFLLLWHLLSPADSSRLPACHLCGPSEALGDGTCWQEPIILTYAPHPISDLSFPPPEAREGAGVSAFHTPTISTAHSPPSPEEKKKRKTKTKQNKKIFVQRYIFIIQSLYSTKKREEKV